MCIRDSTILIQKNLKIPFSSSLTNFINILINNNTKYVWAHDSSVSYTHLDVYKRQVTCLFHPSKTSSVLFSSVASIVPAFSTVTIYVATAPGCCKFTSNVADNLLLTIVIMLHILLPFL